jgi:uncharacterized protein YutE (UPF0331/DUF86 family)
MQQPDPVLLAKADTIRRCTDRARQALSGSADFSTDADAQDIAVLNVIRACEAAIDMAMRQIKDRDLPLPASSGDAFTILAGAKIIAPEMAGRLRAMTGFRNVAVHDYTRLDLSILVSVIEHDLSQLSAFAHQLIVE